jgi:hypothetical protein
VFLLDGFDTVENLKERIMQVFGMSVEGID